MTLDTEVEKLYDSYFDLKNSRERLRADPSKDNYDFRNTIPDANGEPMLTQDAGVVDMQLEDYVARMAQQMNVAVTSEIYSSIRSEFYEPLNDVEKRLAYIDIAKAGVLPDEPSEELKEILKLVDVGDKLKHLIVKNEYDGALKLMNMMIQNGLMKKKRSLAYQYNLLGQGANVRAIASHFEQIQYNMAANKVSDAVIKEIDDAIAEKNAYGIAGAEITDKYREHEVIQQLQQQAQEANQR